MPAVQDPSSLGRGRGHRHVHGRDDRVRARRGRFLGGVVRALSDDLPRARGPGQTSRGGPQGREGRRRRESRTRDQVWRAVDPAARRDPGWPGGRPNCRRASSRCAGAAIAASPRCLSVDRGSTFRDGASPGAELLEPRLTRPRRHCDGATRRRGLAGDERRLVGESDSCAGAMADRIVTTRSSRALVRSKDSVRAKTIARGCQPTVLGAGGHIPGSPGASGRPGEGAGLHVKLHRAAAGAVRVDGVRRRRR